MDGDGLPGDGAKPKICSHLLQVHGLPILKWACGGHVGFGASLLGCPWCKSYGKTGHSEKRLQSVNICWSHSHHGKIIFFLARRWGNQGPLHCLLFIVTLISSHLLGTSGFSRKLTYMVSHSLMLFIPLLRLPEVPFDRGRYPFPGITFPRCFWLKGKPRKTPTILIKM